LWNKKKRNKLYIRNNVFFIVISLFLSFFSFSKEILLLFWFMYYAYRISSFCCCHPMARPTFITVHRVVVSPSTTRHDLSLCLLTQHWNQEDEREKRGKGKNDCRNSREDTHRRTRHVKDNSWARSNFSFRGQAKNNIVFLMGIAINLSFSSLFHWHILEEHEHTMMYVSMHQSVFIRCHSCSTIICFVFAISINYTHTCNFTVQRKNYQNISYSKRIHSYQKIIFSACFLPIPIWLHKLSR
jgi:hypothetical protein